LVLSGCLLTVSLGPALLLAQEAPRKSEIRGIVVRAEDRAPVPGARISLDGTELSVTSDKKGKFKFPKVAAGRYVVRAEVDTFPPAITHLSVEDNDRMEVEFQVGAAVGQVLPELEVSTDAPEISPVAEFNRRAQEGHGRYFTRAEIERRQPNSLMDLLRTVPGARVVCPRTEHVCYLRLRRAACNPAYYIDGIPTDPSVLYLTVPQDVEGIEVYSGPSETPAQLEGFRAGCGAIAIWTRVGRRPG
jgi:hypothetical protein